jgi:hypothetical protein
MAPADAKARLVASEHAPLGLSAWLLRMGCIDYEQQLRARGYKSTDDMYELQGESDESIRATFAFIGAAKRAHPRAARQSASGRL